MYNIQNNLYYLLLHILKSSSMFLINNNLSTLFIYNTYAVHKLIYAKLYKLLLQYTTKYL